MKTHLSRTVALKERSKYSWIVLFSSLLFIFQSCKELKDEDIYLSYPVPHVDFEEMVYSPESTQFAVWAPTADEARVMLYNEGENGHPERMFKMELDEDTGVWSTTIHEDLVGVYYSFNVRINEVWQGDTPGLFARAVGVNGKRGAILNWNTTHPQGWSKDTIPSYCPLTDAILYEVHPRSYSIASSSGVNKEYKGGFLGIVADSYYRDNPAITTGINHLKELGVTHVKLMPSFDFNGIDEKHPQESSFSWGYDPLNYNVPEGLYATDAVSPISRIKEFKEMILELHRAGIRVVMDVSYAYATPALSNFEKTVPGYFFKQDKNGEYLFAQNGKVQLATHRPFVAQMILRSMLYWVKEYHIDGFYLDNMELYDKETLSLLDEKMKEIKPSILLCGGAERQNKRVIGSNQAILPELLFTYSEAIRSNSTDSLSMSFLQRDSEWIEPFKLGQLGSIEIPDSTLVKDSLPDLWKKYIPQPYLAINSLSYHEGLTFSDYLDVHTSSVYYNNEKMRLSKLAYTALFTAQGAPMLYAGEEFMRSKGKEYYTAKCGDDINEIDWELKQKNIDHFNYVKGLIDLRKKHSAFRMNDADMIRKHIEFLPTEKPFVVAYRIKDNAHSDEWEDIVCIFNAEKEALRVALPEGQYIVVCRDGYINEQGLSYAYGQAYVSGQSAMILYRTDKRVYIPRAATENSTKEDHADDEDVTITSETELSSDPIESIE